MGLTVVHVAQSSEYGLGRYLAELVADQVERGWDVHVAGDPASEIVGRVEAAGGRWWAWAATRASGPAVVAEARHAGRIVRAAGADVVHLHSSKAGLAGRLALRGRRPTLFQPHAWSFHAERLALAWERYAARWASAVVCCSEAERAEGEAAGIGAVWRVVPNAVDTAAFRPGDRAAARRALGLDPDAPLAVCVGRLAAAQKGQDVLLAAWPAVSAEMPAARLVVVGDGPDRLALERAAPPGVAFAGHVEDVAAWYTAADVVVQPSRYEGLSMTVLEAMACGRPVVAADATGMREAVGEGGEVVPVGDAAALARAVVGRLGDPGRAAAEGSAARHRVEERHDRRRWCEAMAAVTLEVARCGSFRETGPPGGPLPRDER